MSLLAPLFLILFASQLGEPQADLEFESVTEYEFSKPYLRAGYKIRVRTPSEMRWAESESAFHRAILVVNLPTELEPSWNVVACRLVSEEKSEQSSRPTTVVLPIGKNHVTQDGFAFILNDVRPPIAEERWEILLWPRSSIVVPLSKKDFKGLKVKLKIQEIQTDATRLGSGHGSFRNRFRR